jgi:glutamate dehydrogenase (NADP+)
VSDSRGAVHCSDGLNVDRLLDAKRQGGSVVGLAGAGGVSALADDELIAVGCDRRRRSRI